MAINKKLIHFDTYSDFSSHKLSANAANTQYTQGVGGSVTTGSPDILYQSICWIKDTQQMWYRGQLYYCKEVDLKDYLTESQIAEIYQNKLVSGTNIKTINGESVLGQGDIVIKNDSVIDASLSTTSENAVQNKVVTSAINNIDARVADIENFFDEGNILNLTIKSTLGDDEVIAAVKATIEYDNKSYEIGSGTHRIPGFSDVKITFPDIEGYKTPTPIEFASDSLVAIYEVTYETELVKVSVYSWDNSDIIGQIITINDTQYTWNGTTIELKFPYGSSYSIKGGHMEYYISPNFEFVASQPIREVSATYSKLNASWITVNQTITDPSAMITGDINGEHIQLIRNNSHRYLCKNTSEGVMNICQLDDENSNLYYDGSSAVLTGDEGDVCLKLPKFYYRVIVMSADIVKVGFYYSSTKPSPKWKEWDGGTLMGCYWLTDRKITMNNVNYSVGFSVSGATPSQRLTLATMKADLTRRGAGFSLFKWKHVRIMALLFYATYGNVKYTSIVGTGASYPSATGGSNAYGMTEHNASSSSNSFFGLENYACGGSEFIDDVLINSPSRDGVWHITEDGVTRSIQSSVDSGYVDKIALGEDFDMVPTSYEGTSTTGYQSYMTSDYASGSYTTDHICILGGYSSTYMSPISLQSYANTSLYYSAARLIFDGDIIVEDDVTAFKNLSVISYPIL